MGNVDIQVQNQHFWWEKETHLLLNMMKALNSNWFY